MPSPGFDKIKTLYRRRIDDPEVAAFLSQYPQHVVRKPSDGQQYVLFKGHGFDLLFQPLPGRQGGRTAHLRVLTTVFLFREGDEGHRPFPQPPFGVRFGDGRDTLTGKLGESFQSSLTKGQPELWWEKWRVDGLTLHVRYDLPSLTAKTFSLSVPELTL